MVRRLRRLVAGRQGPGRGPPPRQPRRGGGPRLRPAAHRLRPRDHRHPGRPRARERGLTVSTRTIRLRLDGTAAADRSYDIVVGRGVIAGIGSALAAASARRSLVVADANVAGSHGARVLDSLRAAGIDAAVVAVPPGEASKSAAEAARLWGECGRLAIDRRTHVVAVGGGVVGDLAG
ncbi:MAG: iron-containing alcohol dehydrogenase, partial [Planctomycetia bacterium]|nr:iron-containing alcohol dehydrogenase [Planctomycetia bacterium]